MVKKARTTTTYLFTQDEILKALKIKGSVEDIDLGYAEDFLNDSDEEPEDLEERVLAITVVEKN